MIINANKIATCDDRVKRIATALEQKYRLYGDVIITDGLRTMDEHISIYKKLYGKNWDKKIPTSSAHLTGEAMDFKILAPIDPIKIAAYLLDLFRDLDIKGIGVPLGTWAFHVDVMERNKKQIEKWYYNNKGKMVRP